MAKFIAKIIDPVGLHARPASVLAKVAGEFESDITIKAESKEGNVKSIMNIMALGIKQGVEVTIEAHGVDADAAIEKIKSTMTENKLI